MGSLKIRVSKDLKIVLLFSYDRKKELLDGIYKMGYNTPSKIQETALPVLLADP